MAKQLTLITIHETLKSKKRDEAITRQRIRQTLKNNPQWCDQNDRMINERLKLKQIENAIINAEAASEADTLIVLKQDIANAGEDLAVKAIEELLETRDPAKVVIKDENGNEFEAQFKVKFKKKDK